MFDLGFSELLIIGVVALIVVGPKDLPVLFRNVGQFVGRMRGMARDFSRAMDQAADESGMKDATNSFKSAASGLNDIRHPGKAAAKVWNKASQDLNAELNSAVKPATETDKLRAARAEEAAARHAEFEDKLWSEAEGDAPPSPATGEPTDESPKGPS